MNWTLILLLSLFGPVVGAFTVFGVFPRGVDRFVWMVVVGVCAWTVAKREPARALPTGAVVGFITGASSTLVQALWVDTLAANNPWMVEALAGQPAGFDFEFFVFMLVPFIGVAGGAMTGLLAMLAARALAARDAARKP
ncbi:MAG TPA: hypothetical protein VEC56_06025 [Candidatus Krumholzibacteria bacterium]|nr:hypothetical protein [Candidatus Krumholzibacteria bacterium]